MTIASKGIVPVQEVVPRLVGAAFLVGVLDWPKMIVLREDTGELIPTRVPLVVSLSTLRDEGAPERPLHSDSEDNEDPPHEEFVSEGSLRIEPNGEMDPNLFLLFRVNGTDYAPRDGRWDGSAWTWRLRPESRPWVDGQNVSMGVKMVDLLESQYSDRDDDGLLDRFLYSSGPSVVTEDADSYNIDLNGDGVADIIIPKQG